MSRATRRAALAAVTFVAAAASPLMAVSEAAAHLRPPAEEVLEVRLESQRPGQGGQAVRGPRSRPSRPRGPGHSPPSPSEGDLPSRQNAFLIKTQIQLPDHLHRGARRIAAEYEMSFAEGVRRGLERLLPSYPPRPEGGRRDWQLPRFDLGLATDPFDDPEWRADLQLASV